MKPSLFVQYSQATQQFIDSVKVNDSVVHWFKPILRAWHKAHGTPPTPQQLTVAVALTNKRSSPGVECLSTAMSLRPEGYTVAQYTSVATTGTGETVGPANNKRKALVNAGVLDYQREGKPYRYLCVLTPKGIKSLTAQLAAADLAAEGAKAEAKPAKAKGKPAGKRKAKKASKVPATETPTSEPATVTVDPEANQQPASEPVENEVAEALGVTPDALAELAQHFNQG